MYCSGKEAVFVVVVGGGYLCGWLDLVWMCPGMRYCLGLMSKRLFVILYMVESLASALLCSNFSQLRCFRLTTSPNLDAVISSRHPSHHLSLPA